MTVLALLLARLDQDIFVPKVMDRPLYCACAKLGVALDRILGAPDARTIIARLVRQEHDDLFAWSTP
jgi:hypothetical protein